MEKSNCALPKNESSWQSGLHMKKDEGRTVSHQEIEKYRRLLQDIPDPNFGRIRELKESIRKGTFLTKEAIQETAERIAARFLGKDHQ